jgi:hypothetical protein
LSGSSAGPSAQAKFDQTLVDYTPSLAAGEAAYQCNVAPWRNRIEQSQPRTAKEIGMFRVFTTAAALALTITAAQAGTPEQLAVQIHNAAVTACAPERATGALPRSHYGAIDDQCVYRVSRSAMDKYQAQATAAQSSKFANK